MRSVAIGAFVLMLAPASALAQNFKAYQNYDFVPGDHIVFEDDFRADTDGEFPAHWSLLSGQGVVNKVDGEPALALTEGNYAKVSPRVKGDSYLTDQFTVEFDYYSKAGGYGSMILFLISGDDTGQLTIGHDVSADGFEHDLSATYPGDSDAFSNKWHHAAVVFRKGQLKIYEDQYRVLVVPDTGALKPQSLAIGGIADTDNPLLLRNVRVATGGGMNMIDRLTKDGRIVTHGILFDSNKATLKPESMGTISQIVKMMQETPGLRLEVDGHTDADGDAAKNQALSDARAAAVKAVIVAQGVDQGRLSTKGFGASKPVGPNDTPEGKANNRRVEFVKVG